MPISSFKWRWTIQAEISDELTETNLTNKYQRQGNESQTVSQVRSHDFPGQDQPSSHMIDMLTFFNWIGPLVMY